MSCSSNQLIPAQEALDFLLSVAQNTTKSEIITLENALGRILATDILATINVPEFDNSAMDGYAINFDETLTPPYIFPVVDRIIAGDVGGELAPNTAARIFTGAPTPLGCNTVIPQEDCELEGGNVIIHRPIAHNENIRPRGNDIKADDVILTKGKKLTPADIALIASIGVYEISVLCPITAGVFFSGNELLEPYETLTSGKIYNSNKYSLLAMLTQLGVNIVNLGIIKDNLEATKEALTTLSEQCDVIITTGGVSVGEEDHIKPAVESLGTIDMWKVKMKPGKPLAYGKINTTHFIGLPGNPVSAIATFVLFVRPFLAKLMGNKNYNNQHFLVQIDYAWKAQLRREFVRVKLDRTTTPPTATKYHKQGSDVLSSTSWAEGLAEMPDEQTLNKGALVNFYPF